jgi:acyl carrier protein
MEDRIMREEVLLFLEKLLPQVDFRNNTSLVDDEILDSLAMVTIIAEMSMEFDINIPYEEISADNFNSVDAITAMVQRLQNSK